MDATWGEAHAGAAANIVAAIAIDASRDVGRMDPRLRRWRGVQVFLYVADGDLFVGCGDTGLRHARESQEMAL